MQGMSNNVTALAVVSEVDRRIAATVRALTSAQDREVGDVAAAIGIGRTTLYQKLKGERPFKAQEVDALAKFFQVRVSDLYDGFGGRLFPPGPPDPDRRSGGRTAALPHLDSNQEPTGNGFVPASVLDFFPRQRALPFRLEPAERRAA